MRFATRAFAFSFIPFAVVLGFSYLALQSMTRRNVRDQLRSDLRDRQISLARTRTANSSQLDRCLRLAGENPALTAGLQLLNSQPDNPEARRRVAAELQKLSLRTGFPFLSVANFKREPVAWVVRDRDRPQVPPTPPSPVLQGLAEFHQQLYQLVSVPIDPDRQNLGFLTAGDRFDLADFGVPVVLSQNGRILRTSLADASVQSLATALAACADRPECEVRLNGASWLSIRMNEAAPGPGYVLRSLQNIDSAAAPAEAGLRSVFLSASVGAALAAFIFAIGASRSMVRPLADVVSHLQKSQAAGLLMELPVGYGRIVEIRDLIRSFNQAAASIRDARHGLHVAYVEFVESLANALESRDRYTAGHSQRVSQISASIARSLNLDPAEQERVRVGALLHDIGKIGIPDAVLQKPGALTDAEFTLIKQHPTIGCRILEGVNGFAPYLQSVELHHENWDGSGYPRGLRGEEVPLAARIIHVADAWDAMTTDRPYRNGFSHARAFAVIRINAGTQFDPEIVEVFSRLLPPETTGEYQSILSLAAAVGPPGATVPSFVTEASVHLEQS